MVEGSMRYQKAQSVIKCSRIFMSIALHTSCSGVYFSLESCAPHLVRRLHTSGFPFWFLRQTLACNPRLVPARTNYLGLSCFAGHPLIPALNSLNGCESRAVVLQRQIEIHT